MIIKQVYDVYADNLPSSRSEYSATVKSPVAILSITKQFKTWAKFVLEYNKYAIAQRNAAPKTVQKVVTPKGAPSVKKDV
jgi:hypothetical protein